MKERIYSIPLTDALNEDCGCILCTLEKKLEEEAAAYFLGPSLMEPDSREVTNEKGFCRRHLGMLLGRGNRLGLALMLETHLIELSKKVELKKGGLFSGGYDFSDTAQRFNEIAKNCALCYKLNSQMKEAAGNLVYLWQCETDFRKKFENSDGLCLEHAALVISECKSELGAKRAAEFAESVCENQKRKLAEMYDDVHNFTLSFDYRNKGKPDEKITNSVQCAAEYLMKF